jgi:plasmid stability protein
MTRTTLDLDHNVTKALRERAKREGKSMGQVASEELARALAEEPVDAPPFRWVSHHMGEPLVDLEDKAAVWAILDDRG